MKKTQHIQYTIRGISPALDRCLREKAERDGQSLNTITVSLLERGLGLSAEPIRCTDLDDLAGTWVRDPAFDDAVARLHQIEPDLWK